MAKPKLTLEPAPTFKHKVGIPVPGGEDVQVQFVFAYRDKAEVAAFIDTNTETSDLDYVMALVQGWDLDYEFSRENMEKLLTKYAGAAVTIINGYFGELSKVRRGN